MNLMPLVGFYWRRHAQISKLMEGGGDGEGIEIAVGMLIGIAPVIKKHWPKLNEDGLLDDFISSVAQAMTDKTEGGG